MAKRNGDKSVEEFFSQNRHMIVNYLAVYLTFTNLIKMHSLTFIKSSQK